MELLNGAYSVWIETAAPPTPNDASGPRACAPSLLALGSSGYSRARVVSELILALVVFLFGFGCGYAIRATIRDDVEVHQKSSRMRLD
jgi:hypothetical protein